ncbi:ABC transporter permease [Kangiella sp. TOML190]|uniref:ABC transporter permease n=1 Tax=Kangiella sp. TOML190 TaxID=2931351 RepID=UPI00203DFBEE|nr:ABC transporter permease [Kangiella sp. TOML190]
MLKPIVALMKKDIKLLFKDKMAVFFTFVFPLIFAFFFGSIFSGSGTTSKGMKIAVADLDQSENSAAFVQELKDADEFRVELLAEAAARESVRKGKKVAFIILPQGFGENYAGLFSGSAPEILVGIDPARKAEAGYLQGSLMNIGVSRFEKAFGDGQEMIKQFDDSIASIQQSDDMPQEWKSLPSSYLPKMKELTEKELAEQKANGEQGSGFSFGGEGGDNPMIPLKVTQEDISVQKNGPQNAFAITIPQGVIWAIMGCVIGFAVSLVQEKTLGTVNRLAIAPISRTQILAGKALGCFVAQTFVVTLLFSIAYFILKVDFNLPKLILAVLAVGSCFVGVMMFFASLARTERSVAGLTNAFLVIMGMIGGAMIPLFVMPSWMQSISHISPVKWSILAFEGAIWRDFSYPEMMTPVAILLTVGIVSFFFGTRMLKLEEA